MIQMKTLGRGQMECIGHNGSHNDLLRRSVEEDTRLDEARSETMEEWM